jgi:hypothetical protein
VFGERCLEEVAEIFEVVTVGPFIVRPFTPLKIAKCCNTKNTEWGIVIPFGESNSGSWVVN